jgi:D-tyrosyl-tRNA(Tyr) deacylase
MRVVIQRVSEASVTIEGAVAGSIGKGFVILLGVNDSDTEQDADALVKKLVGLRVFNDEEGKMNLSCGEVGGQYLVISQFTLYASAKKGNRPSFIDAARPDKAIPLYEYFVSELRKHSSSIVETGEFGADMKVSLVNDGPVTIIIESADGKVS